MREIVIDSLEKDYKTIITDGFTAQQTALTAANTGTAAHKWPLVTEFLANNQLIVNRNGTQEDRYIEDTNEWTIPKEMVVKEENASEFVSTKDKSLTAEDIVNEEQIETDTGSDGCVDNTNDEKEIKKETEDTDCKPIITDEWDDTINKDNSTTLWPLITEIHAINHSIIDRNVTQKDRYIADTNERTICEEVVVVNEVGNESSKESAVVKAAPVLGPLFAEKHHKMMGSAANVTAKSANNSQYTCGWIGCHKTFRLPALLAVHQRLSHGSATQPVSEATTATTSQQPIQRLARLGNYRLTHLSANAYLSCEDIQHSQTPPKTSAPVTCDQCGHQFPNETALKTHSKSHPEPKQERRRYRCEHQDCPYYTNSRFLFGQHQKRHLNVRDVKCEIPGCGRSFISNFRMKYHMSSKHRSGPRPLTYRCDHTDCAYESKYKIAVTAHKRNHQKTSGAPKRYQCEYEGCHFETNSRCNLDDHRERPNPIHKHLRPDCGQTSATRKQCRQPAVVTQRTLPAPVTYRCDRVDCAYESHDKKALIAHKKIHPKTAGQLKRYHCEYEGCDFGSNYKHHLKVHEKRSHLNLKEYKCSVDGCGKQYTIQSELNTHARLHSDESEHHLPPHMRSKRYMCPEPDCGRYYVSRSGLTRHRMDRHSPQRPHRCDWPACEAVFKRKYLLRVHVSTHTASRDLKCPIDECAQSYASKYELKKHSEQHKTGTKRRYQCPEPECGKYLVSASALTKHRKTRHSTERPHRCDWPACEAAFKLKYSLQLHVSTHTGVRDFECPVEGCGKRFITHNHLYAHKLTHDLHYSCDWPDCGQRFGVKYQLTAHTNRHAGVRPFACPHVGCDRSFFDRKYMNRHKLMCNHKVL